MADHPLGPRPWIEQALDRWKLALIGLCFVALVVWALST
jgi:cbb3-type cytochrome oxidase subunit 3